MVKQLFNVKVLDYLKESNGKVLVNYRLIDNINKRVEGDLYFKEEIFRFVSGGSGKGYAPRGHYKAYADQLKHRSEDSYSQFGFGWVLPLGAQFKTDRSKIMIHPCGGVPNTTLGCIGLNFESLDENVACYNLFRNYFDKSNILNVEVF